MFFLILILIIIIIIVLLLLIGWHRRPINAPPSPPGRLPWFGHLMQLGPRAHITYRNWWQKHGDLLFVQLGDQAALLVSSPDLHREIYGSTNGRASLERPPLAIKELTANVIGGPGVLWAAGAEWRAHRAFVNNTMLSPSKVLQAVPQVFAEVQRCIVGFERAVAATDDGDVEVMARLFQVAMNSLTIVALGRRLFDVDTGDGLEFRDAVLTIFDVAGEPHVADYVRVLRRFLPPPPSFRRCADALRLISECVNNTLEERAKLSPDSKSTRNIVDEVIELDGRLSRDEALRSVKELLNAGGETTTSVLTWALVAAAEHPLETQRVIDEIDRVVGTATPFVDATHLERMPVFDAWLKETVRVFPLARVNFPRVTTKEIEVGGFTIPANTMILIHRQAIMNHQSFWREPERFNIDRWLPGGEATNSDEVQWAFPFFASGPRVCPGQHLATWEVRLTVANLLHRFKIQYSPRFQFDPVEDTETKLTTRPKGGKLILNFKIRK
jgi:cytochrome P450